MAGFSIEKCIPDNEEYVQYGGAKALEIQIMISNQKLDKIIELLNQNTEKLNQLADKMAKQKQDATSKAKKKAKGNDNLKDALNVSCLDDLNYVYSLIFQSIHPENDLSGKNRKYYRVDINVNNSYEDEINATLLRHIRDYENHPVLKYDQIITNYCTSPIQMGTLYSSPYKDYYGFFFDSRVRKYRTKFEVNKDRLIDFADITDFKSKTQKAMKELTKFDIK